MKEKFPVFNLYHHYFFSEKTLRKLLEVHGYEVIKIISTFNCYSFEFFIHKLPGAPKFLRNFLLGFLKIIKISDIPISISFGNIGIIARRKSS